MSPIFLLLLPFLSADWRFVSFTPLELSVYPASEVRLCGDAGTSKATLANARRKRREASFVPLEDEEEREKSEATEAKSFGRRTARLKKKKKKNLTPTSVRFLSLLLQRFFRRGTAPAALRVLFRLPRRLLFDIARALLARVDGNQSRRRPHRGEEQAISDPY